MSALHAKRFDAAIVSQHEIAATWHIIDCKCGWQSPLCEKRDKAQRLYDAHRKRKASHRMTYQVCSTSLFSRPQRNSWKAAPYMGWPRL